MREACIPGWGEEGVTWGSKLFPTDKDGEKLTKQKEHFGERGSQAQWQESERAWSARGSQRALHETLGCGSVKSKEKAGDRYSLTQ